MNDKEKLSHKSIERLLQRPIPAEYVAHWTELLAREKQEGRPFSEVSVLIFRLGREWFGMSIQVFKEILDYRKIHLIPHISDEVILGLVNLNGQLRICVSLSNLLGVEADYEIKRNQEKLLHSRMIAIEKEGAFIIFPVDDVQGIIHISATEIENVPITVAKSTNNFLKGVFTKEKRRLGLLDEELIFYSLRRSLA